jgi:hypothetical protein
MTQIYIAPETAISADEFDCFPRQFVQRKPLDEIKLCAFLFEQWNQHVINRRNLASYAVTLPSTKHLRKYLPKKKQGLYAIYAKFKSRASPKCFYVGISPKKRIYERVAQYLYGDIRKKYCIAFKQLKKALEIVICYGTTQLAKEKANRHLMLLEDCMTVLSRPSFLYLAAGSRKSSR